MKINLCSIKSIFGDCTEFLVYGLTSCHYIEIMKALKVHHFTVHLGKDYPNILGDNGPEVLFDGIFLERSAYKAALTTFIIDNCKRESAKLPLQKLLFCIEFEDGRNNVLLDLDKLISDSGFMGSVTASEIRHLYKIYSENNNELSGIVEKSCKFVKLKKLNLQNDSEYELQEIPPPWKNSQWNELWLKRQLLHAESHKSEWRQWKDKTKKYFWRDILKSNLTHFQMSSSDVVYGLTLDNQKSVKLVK